jgi:hypothetical protein
MSAKRNGLTDRGDMVKKMEKGQCMKRLSSPLFLMFYALLAALLYLWLAPPRHNPFARPDLTRPPGLGTWHQLTRLKNDSPLCFATLERAGIGFAHLDNTALAKGCGLTGALRLQRSQTPYSAELKMTCAQTAALYTWERHFARPLAEDMLRSQIIRVETFGSFSCRNIAGTGRLSQHAFGNAIDISGFSLADGRLVDVKTHWGTDSDEGRYLKAVHERACHLFTVVLGPDYNAAHADHFHFDMGRGGTCR